MKQILLNLLGLSTLVSADFSRDDATGIVTDNSTKLQWQDDAVGTAMAWDLAIAHCEDMTLGGYTDWRLPNFNELYSIADKSKYNPAIDSTFQSVVSVEYWSSTSVAGYPEEAWNVHFGYGGSKSNGLTKLSSGDIYHVRCVRDGEP